MAAIDGSCHGHHDADGERRPCAKSLSVYHQLYRSCGAYAYVFTYLCRHLHFVGSVFSIQNKLWEIEIMVVIRRSASITAKWFLQPHFSCSSAFYIGMNSLSKHSKFFS
jgi:hypothetical protein